MAHWTESSETPKEFAKACEDNMKRMLAFQKRHQQVELDYLGKPVEWYAFATTLFMKAENVSRS